MVIFFSTSSGFFIIKEDRQENFQFWVKRNALAYITGICPIFMLMAPEYDEENLVELINLGYGTDFSTENLNQAVLQTVQRYRKENFSK